MVVVGVVLGVVLGGGSGPGLPAAGHGSPQAAVAGLFEGLFVQGNPTAALDYVPPDLQSAVGPVLARVGTIQAQASGLGVGVVQVTGDTATVGVVGRICGADVSLLDGSGQQCTSNDNPAPTGDWLVPCVRIGGLWYVDLAHFGAVGALIRQFTGATTTTG